LIKEGAGIGLVPDFQFNMIKSTVCEVFPKLKLPINQRYALHPYDKYLPSSMKVCVEAIENHLDKLSER
jgi:hypothetical protein